MKLSTSSESVQFIYNMAALRQDFSVPPPMFTHGLPPMAPMAIWELQFEKRISQMLTSVTDNLMKNINILSTKLNDIEKNKLEIRKDQNPGAIGSTIIPPLMSIQAKPLLPTPTGMAGNTRSAWDGPQDRRGPMIWGPTKARTYQPVNNQTQKLGHPARREQVNKARSRPVAVNTNPADIGANKPHSPNPDFPAILKGVHKLASIGHHKGNWI